MWLEVLMKMKGTLDRQTPVFCSRVKDPTTGLKRAITRAQARRILKEAFSSNELSGKLGTHAMRKAFCNRTYDKLNHDLVKTQKAMGHANINSTIAYLTFREEDITDAILAA
jgi:site-specific recombinase XerD